MELPTSREIIQGEHGHHLADGAFNQDSQMVDVHHTPLPVKGPFKGLDSGISILHNTEKVKNC